MSIASGESEGFTTEQVVKIGQQGRTKRVLLVVSSNLLSSEMATTRLKPEKNAPQNQQVETETRFQHQAAFFI